MAHSYETDGAAIYRASFATIRAEADLAYGGRSVKAAMRAANRSGARFAVVAGERDLAEGVVQMKDLESGEQRPVALDEIVAVLTERLA